MLISTHSFCSYFEREVEVDSGGIKLRFRLNPMEEPLVPTAQETRQSGCLTEEITSCPCLEPNNDSLDIQAVAQSLYKLRYRGFFHSKIIK
jgi:hypothetical protein